MSNVVKLISATTIIITIMDIILDLTVLLMVTPFSLACSLMLHVKLRHRVISTRNIIMGKSSHTQVSLLYINVVNLVWNLKKIETMIMTTKKKIKLQLYVKNYMRNQENVKKI